MKNLVLIGFMGSGKSSLGRLISAETGRFFLDTDALIESHYARAIGEIFASEGEAAFRAAEKNCAAFLAKSVKNAVIATGGGMPIVCDNLSEIGKVVYLKCSFEAIAKRLSQDAEKSKRPLAASLEILRERYDARLKIYEKSAEIVINAEDPIEICLQNLREKIV
ncbi:MAG: shikimate kinase [Helicobacteraceae bacterium]|jgi:shikimate kinase|nr:shikimate kinase [Helicobacteraceae bacterium]